VTDSSVYNGIIYSNLARIMAKKTSGYWVLRGMRGAAAREKYLDYLSGLVDVSAPDGTVSESKPATKELFLAPFAFTLATDNVVRESGTVDAWALMGGVAPLATRVIEDATGKTPVDIHSYRAPRVVHTKRGATGTTRRSARTGLPYVDYGTESNSLPFGWKTGDTDVETAFAEIAVAINDTQARIKCRLIDERY
jgi:hypothetical protein